MMRGALHPKTHWAVRLCAGLRVDLFRAVLLLPFLLVAGWGGAARAITTTEFNRYWIGDGLNGAGQCSTIVHPRLFTRPESLAVIRERIADTSTPNYQVKAALETFWNNNLGNVLNSECLAMIGNLYVDSLKWETPAAVAACTTCFGVMVDAGFDCTWPPGTQGDQGAWWADYSGTAVAYDLLYHKLNATRKASAYRKLKTARLASRYTDTQGSLVQHDNGRLLPLMAIYGDQPDAATNAAIRDTMMSDIRFLENRCLPCWDAVETIGYGEQYFARRWTNQAASVALIRNTLPGYDAGSDSVASVTLLNVERIANAGRFYRFAWRPGVLNISGWGQTGMERLPSKWDTDEYNTRVINSFVGSVFNDPYSSALASYLGRRRLDIGPINTGGITRTWQTLLWENPYRYEATDWRDAPRFAWNPEMGVLMARDRWGIDSTGVTDTSIRVGYYPAYANAVGHYNAGHWNGMVGDWNQVFDRGRRYVDFEDHMQFYHYFANSILIKTAGESFGNFTAVDVGTSTNGQDGIPGNSDDCGYYRFPLLNGGWQEPGNADTGKRLWPECINNAGSNDGRKYVLYRGSLIEDSVDSANAIYRVSADFDSSFDASEKDYVRRSWLYDGGNNVVVWDQVKVRSNVTDVHSVIGTINEPLCQDGTIEVLRGAGISGAADSIAIDANGSYGAHGGIYRVTGATKIRHTNGAGRAWIYPIDVRNTTDDDDGYLYVIGGRGKGLVRGNDVASWGQTKYPCATWTWSGTSNQTGFAFWTWNGTNVLDGWNMSPGAHARGACTNLDCDDGTTAKRLPDTSDTQPTTIVDIRDRNGSPTAGHGLDAGDWTIYQTVSNPGNNDVCEFIYLTHLQAATTTEPTVAWERSGEVLAVAVNDTMLVMTSPSTLTRPDSIYWENPLANEDATIRVVGLLPSVQYELFHDGVSQGYKTTSAKGYVGWAHTANSVGAFELVLKQTGSGACCSPDGSCLVVAADDCVPPDVYQGDGIGCIAANCQPAVGACCEVDGFCTVFTQAICEGFGGTWQGDGTDCDPNECPQPIGACCATDGTCTTVGVDSCTGTFLGVGTDCSPNPCPQPLDTAACCTSNGTFCTNLTLADCAAAGGVYLDGQICEDDPCYDTTPRACCLPTGACVLVSNTDCTNVLNGVSLAGTTCNLSCLGYPYGACCADDGTCTYVIESDCTGGSVWQGGGVQCNPCVDQTTGACCTTSGCVVVSEADCTTLSGVYGGNGLPCGSDPCESDITGACCFFEGSCRILTESQCIGDGGLYLGDSVDCEFDLCGMRILLNGLRLMRRYLDD